MKKNGTNLFWEFFIPGLQYQRIMKLTFIFTLCGLMSYASATYSQRTKLTFESENSTIEQVFKKIESLSEYKFAYNSSKIDIEHRISVKADQETITSILDKLLESCDLHYEIVDKYIIITDENSHNSRNPQSIKEGQSVTGRVTDSSGNPLPGVTVVVKGTTNGVITDSDGRYSLSNLNPDAFIAFSFIGMKSTEVNIDKRTTINIQMFEETIGVDEVVVTAMGIEKSKKTLTYATQQLEMNSLVTNREVNLGNSLAGRVAGVSVIASSETNGVSGDPRIVIRGIRSINNNNQPLIVVDGIPTSNSGSGLSGINTDDVESINVLKGPAASALYGSSANNGVIVVTTKKGRQNQTNLEVSSGTSFDLPYLYPEFQNEYGHGLDGQFMDNIVNYSWGPKMTGQDVTDWTGKQTKLLPQPDNVSDIFKTGYSTINSFSYGTGVNKSTAYFSYSNTTARGIIETDKMHRNNFNLRLTTELLKNLSIDFKMTYFNQVLEDKPDVTDVGAGQFNIMEQASSMPRSIKTSDIREYSYYTEDLSLRQNVWIPNHTSVTNPYWSMYANEVPSTLNRINTFTTLKYSFTDWLYFQLRGGMNMDYNDLEKKMWWDTKYIWSGKGDYYTTFSKRRDITGDALLVFNKKISNDFLVNATLGGELKDFYGRAMSSSAGGLTVENKFALNFGQTPTTSDGESRIQKQAIYGMARLEFKNYLFLDVTGRTDWSSTLPSPYNYFYPSIGLTALVSDMVKLPKAISFLKVRGSYAEVGNDASFAQIFQTYSASANGPVGMLNPNAIKVPTSLIPESTVSWETGADVRFFGNRLGIDFTWYKSNTYNQLVNTTTPPSSGYTNAWINCGNIQNTGIEMIFTGTPVKTSNFKWNLELNYAQNDNKVIELSETLDRYEVASANFALGRTWVEVGRPFGEMYTKGFVRNDKGQIVVDALGMPKIQSDFLTYVGNFNYDWRSGLNNNFSYKNWNLAFLVDLNYGGVRGSGTEAAMLEAGTSIASLQNRETGLIVDGVKEDGTPNDKMVTAQAYAMLLGGRIDSGSGETFMHGATNSRLRELSLGYTFPLRSKVVKGLQLSLIGRNLFYIYNECKWFDPDNTANTEVNGQGAENSFLPGSRTLGFNIKLNL